MALWDPWGPWTHDPSLSANHPSCDLHAPKQQVQVPGARAVQTPSPKGTWSVSHHATYYRGHCWGGRGTSGRRRRLGTQVRTIRWPPGPRDAAGGRDGHDVHDVFGDENEERRRAGEWQICATLQRTDKTGRKGGRLKPQRCAGRRFPGIKHTRTLPIRPLPTALQVLAPQ